MDLVFKICAIRKQGQVVTLYLMVLGWNDVKTILCQDGYDKKNKDKGKKLHERMTSNVKCTMGGSLTCDHHYNIIQSRTHVTIPRNKHKQMCQDPRIHNVGVMIDTNETQQGYIMRRRREEPILGPIYTMGKGCDHNIVKIIDIHLKAIT